MDLSKIVFRNFIRKNALARGPTSHMYKKNKKSKSLFFSASGVKNEVGRGGLFQFINKRKVMGILLFFGTNVATLGDTEKLGVGGRGDGEK